MRLSDSPESSESYEDTLKRTMSPFPSFFLICIQEKIIIFRRFAQAEHQTALVFGEEEADINNLMH